MVPDPIDPTILTTQKIEREVKALHEILLAVMGGQKAVFESRLGGMDKAVELLQTVTSAQPAQMDDKIFHLRELHQEKFDSIQTQFAERDVRTEQAQRDSKVAVDAALQAAKEAVGKQQESGDKAIAKSEANTTKQLDAIGDLITQSNKGSDDKISDMKERLTRIESSVAGKVAQVQESRAGTSSVMGIITGVIAILGFAFGAAAFLTK